MSTRLRDGICPQPACPRASGPSRLLGLSLRQPRLPGLCPGLRRGFYLTLLACHLGEPLPGAGLSWLPHPARATPAAILALVLLLLPQGLQEDPFDLAQGLVVHPEVLLLPPQGVVQGSFQHLVLLCLDGQPGPHGERAQ